MQTQFSPTEKHQLNKLVRRLSGYGLPGFWSLRWFFFKAVLYFLDKQFVKTDRDRPEHYSVEVENAQFEVRRGTSDSFVIDEVWNKHEYGTAHSGVVIDIGANIGAFTIYAAQTAKHVIAIEASKDNFKRLTTNIDLNGLSNVSATHACAASQPGRSTLHYHDCPSSESNVTSSSNHSRNQTKYVLFGNHC